MIHWIVDVAGLTFLWCLAVGAVLLLCGWLVIRTEDAKAKAHLERKRKEDARVTLAYLEGQEKFKRMGEHTRAADAMILEVWTLVESGQTVPEDA